MSTITVIEQTRNKLHTDFDVSKNFIWNPRFDKDTFLNDTGGVLSLVGGELLGRLTAAPNKLVIMQSGAADGSQTPIGVNCEVVDDIADAADVLNLNFAFWGDVAEEKLVFDGADDLDTTVAGRTIRDLLRVQGLNPVVGEELTGVDNA